MSGLCRSFGFCGNRSESLAPQYMRDLARDGHSRAPLSLDAVKRMFADSFRVRFGACAASPRVCLMPGLEDLEETKS
jgi:hypothetical protein